MVTRVTSQVLEAMRAAADRAYPKEACGMLLADGPVITHFVETANVHPAPETHFEIEPQALIHAHREARGRGPQLIGYFHSHPKGPAEPSQTDRAQAAGDGKIWAIWGEGVVRFWRDGPSGFREVSYSLQDG